MNDESRKFVLMLLVVLCLMAMAGVTYGGMQGTACLKSKGTPNACSPVQPIVVGVLSLGLCVGVCVALKRTI